MHKAESLRQAIMAETARLSPEELWAVYQMVRQFSNAKARRRVPVNGAVSPASAL